MLKSNEIIDRIATVAASAAATAEEIHILAVSCTGHAMLYGDVTLSTRLVVGMPKSVDRKALVTYLVKHGPFVWHNDTASFTLNKKFRNEHEFDEEAMMEGVRWFNYAPETRQLDPTFNYETRILALLKAGERAKKTANVALRDYIADAVKQYAKDKAAALRTIRAQYDADHGVTTAEGPTEQPEAQAA